MEINQFGNAFVNPLSTDSSKKTDKSKKGEAEETQAQDKMSKQGVVYETSVDIQELKEMSVEKRKLIAEQIKEQQEKRQEQFMQLVKDMISKQGGTYSYINEDEIWKTLASGKLKVDDKTKEQAQKDVSEDGYWGVKQTSERIFSFALSLAGDNEANMRKMQAAFEKGFKLAVGSWGKELPDICQDTYDAVSKRFDEYYLRDRKSVV